MNQYSYAFHQEEFTDKENALSLSKKKELEKSKNMVFLDYSNSNVGWLNGKPVFSDTDLISFHSTAVNNPIDNINFHELLPSGELLTTTINNSDELVNYL